MQPIESAVTLKQELDTLRPLSPEDERRIMQKLRLDWNYHSNHLEGNSLTYGETKALLLFGITAGGKPLRDSLEMTGHNEALKWIEEVIREERPLTENFIRQLHELILKEDYQVNAETSDGKPTKKWVRVGKYKTEPNHVETITGEMFYFATPEETPAKMHDLMEWYRQKAVQGDIQPILLAAEFHYQFIRIHPFDDGNGRTARILMNFILMQFGYPPAIIKTEDKQNYFAVLRQADAGVLEPFVEYIAANVVRSLEIMIQGARGKDIEEPDDLDKELALLEQRFRATKERIQFKRNSEKMNREESILDFFLNSIIPLLEIFFSDCLKFRRFYSSSRFAINWNETKDEGRRVSGMKCEGSTEENFSECMSHVQKIIDHSFEKISLSFYYHLTDNFGDFRYNTGMYITFLSEEVNIESSSRATINKLYGTRLTDQEIKKLIVSEAKQHKEILEQKIKEIDEGRNPSNIES